MYEVFFNDRQLRLASIQEGNILNRNVDWHYTGNIAELRYLLGRIFEDTVIREQPPMDVKNVFPGSLPDTNKREFLITGEEDQLWTDFCSLFCYVPAAGGVVENSDGFLFIYRKGKWDLPKGKVDPGETPEMAALREVREETGLRVVQIREKMSDTWHVYPDPRVTNPLKYILKKTSWYRMYAPEGQPLIPEVGEEITQVAWIPAEQLNVPFSGTYRSLQALISNLV